MNSLYQQIMPKQSLPNNMSQLKQAMSMLKGSKNPQQLLMNMMNQNPQLKQVMDLVKNSNKSPKDLFYEMAQQRGVDPNEIINMLR